MATRKVKALPTHTLIEVACQVCFACVSEGVAGGEGLDSHESWVSCGDGRGQEGVWSGIEGAVA